MFYSNISKSNITTIKGRLFFKLRDKKLVQYIKMLVIDNRKKYPIPNLFKIYKPVILRKAFRALQRMDVHF